MSGELPAKARVVVVGGGVIGRSVAYHLAKIGWSDVVLVERRQLACGTTWHAAGLVEKAATIINLLGGSVQTPAEARETLGLEKRA